MVIFSTNNPRKRYPLQSSTPSREEESKVFHSFSGIFKNPLLVTVLLLKTFFLQGMVRTEHSPLEGGLSGGIEFKASIVVLSLTQLIVY